MSTNHKPAASRPTSLPRPPHHHSLPEPPLACALSKPPHSQRATANLGRNHFGHPQPSLQRGANRSQPSIADASRSRPAAHPSTRAWELQPSGQGQERFSTNRDLGTSSQPQPIGAGSLAHPAAHHPTSVASHQNQHHYHRSQMQHHPQHHRQHHQHQQQPQQQPQQWPMSYDELRRNAQHSSSHSHPSPASTSSGSTSSLRTPPDLLLNGNTIGYALSSWKSSSPQHSMLALNSWSGLAVKRHIPPRHMKVEEIVKRRRLLESLPDDLPFALPSPPHTPLSSPRKATRPRSTEGDRQTADTEAGELVDPAAASFPALDGKRKEADRGQASRPAQQHAPMKSRKRRRSNDADEEDFGPRDKRPTARLKGSTSHVLPSSAPLWEPETVTTATILETPSEAEDGELPDVDKRTSGCVEAERQACDRSDQPRPLALRSRTWTSEELGQVATLYRNCGRERKHIGDQLSDKAGSSLPSFASPSSKEVAALEQLDAVLLFCYAFYLSDQEKGPGCCLANNWDSLFGLLRYVTNAQLRFRNHALVGLCRLVEASVLRILHTHNQNLLRSSIANQGAAATEKLPLATLSEGFMKLSSDLDKSDRLASLAGQSLSLGALKRSFPETWSRILENDFGGGDLTADSTALRVDPGTWPSASVFAWPIGPTTPISHLVCFGRNLIREHAKGKGLSFTPVNVKAPL